MVIADVVSLIAVAVTGATRTLEQSWLRSMRQCTDFAAYLLGPSRAASSVSLPGQGNRSEGGHDGAPEVTVSI